MIRDSYNWELAEQFIEGALSEAELKALNTRLETDPVFATDFYECVNMLRTLEDSSRHKEFQTLLTEITTSNKEKNSSLRIPGFSMPLHYLRTSAIAASIAIITTLSIISVVNKNEKRRSSQYSLLKRELETIKRSQNALIKNINEQRTSSPVAQARYSGTGFALSNDGYLVTNYHVTDGADSVYIQNREGEYFKANIVATDEKSDVAILKIENKLFRFGKSDVPYSLAIAKKNLGVKIFTLGYPQDEVVYNEGYISSKNGFQGDTLQYRLEVHANPGQSGAPVLDVDGNVIAIITGKESETEGTTYAVSTKAIYNLVKTLPKEIKIELARPNKLGKLSREQQVEKLEYYTCAVKVYKR